MRTHWNSKLQRQVFILQQSSYHLAQQDEMISTVLGSCIAVCLRDWKNKIGGMNHFLLPSNTTHNSLHWPQNYDSKSLRYGDISMELLINELIKHGAKREFLEAKVFGGASVMLSKGMVGDNNIQFVREYLHEERIPVVAEDVGGVNGRKIYFDVASGEVLRYLIPDSEQIALKRLESEYLERVDAAPVDSCTYFWDDNE